MNLDPSSKPLRGAESPRSTEAVRSFKAFIRRKSYPCMGAKSALSRRALECFCADDIVSDLDDQRIAERVQSFAMAASDDDVFLSLAVLFPASQRMTEAAFEQALWQRLSAIHAIDQLHHSWDARVSDDPASPSFSMSIGGRGFFVIGLHPDASRLARRFQCPVLVFNLHSQFEQLRMDGRYDKLRSSIVERDIAFSGSINPMLATHGERSEARQYSGRIVDENWVCPFASAEKEISK